MIEEVTDYVKIVRSNAIISMRFLKSLRVIHGMRLQKDRWVSESPKYDGIVSPEILLFHVHLPILEPLFSLNYINSCWFVGLRTYPFNKHDWLSMRNPRKLPIGSAYIIAVRTLSLVGAMYIPLAGAGKCYVQMLPWFGAVTLCTFARGDYFLIPPLWNIICICGLGILKPYSKDLNHL